MTEVFLVQLPSPPRHNVFREWAGGMGTSLPSTRTTYGHDQKYYDIPYSSLLYIARRLEQLDIGFRYVDCQKASEFDLPAFLAELEAAQPRVLITVVNIPSLAADLELLAAMRKAVPGLRVVLLGPTAKWHRDRLLRDGDADVVMDSSEELLTAEVAATLLAETPGKPLQACSIWVDGERRTLPATTPMKDLNFVDFPAYELLDFTRYEHAMYSGSVKRYASVFTTKGCPYKCGYCPYPYGFGSRMLYRDPEHVGNDIQRLHDEFGVRQILFRDQVFTLNGRHAKAVCQQLIDRKLDIEWICETRYDLVDREMLELMRRSGCVEVHYGLESADPEMFAQVAKPDGAGSLEQFEQTIALTKELGLKCHVHMIVGLPDESRQSLRNSRDWLRRTRPHSVQFAYFTPYPGTPLYEELRADRSLGDVEAIDWEDYGSFERPVLPTRHLSIEQIVRGRERLAVDWQYTLTDRVKNRARRMLRDLAPAASS